MTVQHIIFLIYFLVNLNFTVSSDDEFDPRIVGGFKCNVTDYPFLVTLLSHILCGGSLITLEWVLTAAHCILPKNGPVEVRTGFTSKYVQKRYSKKTIMHKSYNDKLLELEKEIRYDIGLILLEKPFVRSPAAQPGKLPKIGFTKTCKTIRTAGIGKTSPSERIGEETKRPLKCVDLKVISRSECSKHYPNAVIDNSQICTLDRKGKDTCVGDSGGPLFCKKVIVGVVSFGPDKCGNGIDAASNTKVESYLRFIKDILNKGTSTQGKLIESSSTNWIDGREARSTSTHSRSTEKIASGSCNLHGSLWNSYSNILFCTIFFLIYSLYKR